MPRKRIGENENGGRKQGVEAGNIRRAKGERLREVPNLNFFFKQKTGYEVMPSLVGSEMCMRDRVIARAEVRSMMEVWQCRTASF